MKAINSIRDKNENKIKSKKKIIDALEEDLGALKSNQNIIREAIVKESQGVEGVQLSSYLSSSLQYKNMLSLSLSECEKQSAEIKDKISEQYREMMSYGRKVVACNILSQPPKK